MTQQNENTPIVDDNNATNDNTKVEPNVDKENMVPQSRVNELTAKNHKLQADLDKYLSNQESDRKKKLEEQGELKTLLDEQSKDLEKYKTKADEYDVYKTNKKADLMEQLSDDDKLFGEDMKLAKLEKFVASRVGQTNTVGTPNQRPANSTKGTGEYGGYSSTSEWAQKDPAGFTKHLETSVDGYIK